jgi:hypothetical protein
VSKGRPGRAGRYAVLGAVGGGVFVFGAAWIVGWASGEAIDGALGTQSTTQTSDYVEAGLVGAGIGAAIGALVGAAWRGPERWEPVDPVVVQFGLGRGEPALCLTVRY